VLRDLRGNNIPIDRRAQALRHYSNGFCPQCRGELRSPKRYIIKAQVPNLKKTWLSGANLNGSNLFLANLENAYLYRANLQAANLSSTHLYKANLSLANLATTNLFSANLKGADLSGTNLSNSNLGNANFEGAKNLSIEQVKSACFWQTAKFDLPFQKLLYQTPESSAHRNLCLKLWFYIPSTSTQQKNQ